MPRTLNLLELAVQVDRLSWAIVIAALAVALSLSLFGIEKTNIAISVVTLLMLFILQNTQNRDSEHCT